MELLVAMNTVSRDAGWKTAAITSHHLLSIRKPWLYPILYESVETDDVSQNEIIDDDDDGSRKPVGVTFDSFLFSEEDAKEENVITNGLKCDSDDGDGLTNEAQLMMTTARLDSFDALGGVL
ncbi:hypothetical protein X777_15316 [Ooceraea biroi]|uniref:Uncharacterized protein n=1 Tax=Ooceraea biroi TaxID=2015173 RepID=A0A026WY14_OOCBI|nr:hypothetical protein X777_15316 [Ooceraea biroi]